VEYQIGSSSEEPGRGANDESYHPVRIDRSFALSATEVTKEQFIRFQENYRFASNPRAPDPQCPAVSVNWVEAVAYCRWLCEQENIPPEEWCYPQDIKVEIGLKLPDNFLKRTGYRLPTEAEWEYACRAGAAGRYCFGNGYELLRAYAWFQDNSRGRTWPVGSLKPNARGFFDMHGNVRESCHDIYRSETKSVDIGETRPLRRNTQTVSRGGAYGSLADEVRSANRRGDDPTARVSYAAGFRVARTYESH